MRKEGGGGRRESITLLSFDLQRNY